MASIAEIFSVLVIFEMGNSFFFPNIKIFFYISLIFCISFYDSASTFLTIASAN